MRPMTIAEIQADQIRLYELRSCGALGRVREDDINEKIIIREWHPEFAPSAKDFLRPKKPEGI